MASYEGENQDILPQENSDENRREETQARRAREAYVKGFSQDVSLIELIYFFEQLDVGEVDNIIMRNFPNGDFKGSVYATFHRKDDMEKFVSLPTVKFGTDILKKQPTLDFFKEKEEGKKEKKLGKIKRRKEEQKIREEMKRLEIIDQMTKGAVLNITNIPADKTQGDTAVKTQGDTADKTQRDTADKTQRDTADKTQGDTAAKTQRDAASKTQRDEIKDYFTEFGSVAWIDFTTGHTEAYVRFTKAGEASKVLEAAKAANDDKIVLNKHEVDVRLLEGDEEITHWKNLLKEKDKKRAKKKTREKKKFNEEQWLREVERKFQLRKRAMDLHQQQEGTT